MARINFFHRFSFSIPLSNRTDLSCVSRISFFISSRTSCRYKVKHEPDNGNQQNKKQPRQFIVGIIVSVNNRYRHADLRNYDRNVKIRYINRQKRHYRNDRRRFRNYEQNCNNIAERDIIDFPFHRLAGFVSYDFFLHKNGYASSVISTAYASSRPSSFKNSLNAFDNSSAVYSEASVTFTP